MAESLEQARELLLRALRQEGIEPELLSRYAISCRTSYTEFKLSFMPGNRRTLISHAVAIRPECRGHGLGTLYCRVRERAAREAGVTLMLATVMDDNKPEISLLLKCGWRRLTQNTTTHCSLWGKELQP
jgi:GNAT superfamily N-acetyltransferase